MKINQTKMNYLLKLFVILNCFLVFSCKNEGDERPNGYYEDFFSIPKIGNEMIADAINKNDTQSYNDVWGYYFLSGRDKMFLSPAMIMANKNNYNKAYYHVYCILASKVGGGQLKDVDLKTKNLAFYYLTRAKELGCDEAREEYEEQFGMWKNLPASDTFLKEFSKN